MGAPPLSLMATCGGSPFRSLVRCSYFIAGWLFPATLQLPSAKHTSIVRNCVQLHNSFLLHNSFVSVMPCNSVFEVLLIVGFNIGFNFEGLLSCIRGNTAAAEAACGSINAVSDPPGA